MELVTFLNEIIIFSKQIMNSLPKRSFKWFWLSYKGSATWCALSGSPSRVPPGSPRFTMSQSSPTFLFFNHLYMSIFQFIFFKLRYPSFLAFPISIFLQLSILRCPLNLHFQFSLTCFHISFKYGFEHVLQISTLSFLLNLNLVISFSFSILNYPLKFDSNLTFKFRFKQYLWKLYFQCAFTFRF